MMIFDFDGVLIDSAKEACVSAYNAVHETEIRDFADLPGPLTGLFFKNIFHFYNPYTLYSLVAWCSENYETNSDKIMTRDEFKAYLEVSNLDPKVISPYFYSVRKKFMLSFPEEWVKMNTPFMPLWNALQSSKPETIIILTAKNKSAVLKLSHNYGLMIPEENIYAGDNNTTKVENFRLIQERFPNEEFEFIDDHLVNLKALDSVFNLKEKQVNLILCNWGYGDPEDLVKAKELGYEVLAQEEVIERI